MVARTFDELDCWKLSYELKTEVHRLIDKGPASRDFKFRDQVKDAAASPPRNIAEGFGRYKPKEFAQYLRVANGSLMETSNHLRDGVDRGYFRQSDVAPLLRIAKRASAATTSLARYLDTATAPPSKSRKKPKNPKNPRT